MNMELLMQYAAYFFMVIGALAFVVSVIVQEMEFC